MYLKPEEFLNKIYEHKEIMPFFIGSLSTFIDKIANGHCRDINFAVTQELRYANGNKVNYSNPLQLEINGPDPIFFGAHIDPNDELLTYRIYTGSKNNHPKGPNMFYTEFFSLVSLFSH